MVNNSKQMVRLTWKEAYALLMFLRCPGVAEGIEQADAAAQAQDWRKCEESQERECTAGR